MGCDGFDVMYGIQNLSYMVTEVNILMTKGLFKNFSKKYKKYAELYHLPNSIYNFHTPPSDMVINY